MLTLYASDSSIWASQDKLNSFKEKLRSNTLENFSTHSDSTMADDGNGSVDFQSKNIDTEHLLDEQLLNGI